MTMTNVERARVDEVRTLCNTPAAVEDGAWQRARDALGAAVPDLLAVLDRLELARVAMRTDVLVALSEAQEVADRTGADYARGRRDALAWFAGMLEDAR